MSKKSEQEEVQREAVATLREMFPVGTTVRTVLRHVSASGMSRAISVVTCVDGHPRDVSHLVATATGNKLDPRHPGIRVGGCGMDMGFHLVYGLARTLHGDGFTCTGNDGQSGRRCPSNDHANDWNEASRDGRAQGLDDQALRDYVHARLSSDLTFRKDRKHSDGGYALSQAWL